MATTPVTVQVNTIGADCGPFTIADNVSGTITSGVSRTTLLSGIVVNADETASQITVSSGGVCTGSNINISISGIICPTPPPPEFSYWTASYYPCDGFCESPGDVTVAFPGGFTPTLYRWFRGPEYIYRITGTATAPYDIYLSDTTQYPSCLDACESTPPPPTYEWYELINCDDSTGAYSQNYTPGTFAIGDRVTNVGGTITYRINSIYSTNPGGIQYGIIGTGYTGCPTTPPVNNCRQNITLNVTDTGYIKYYNCTTATTDYYYIASTGSITLSGCIDYTTIIPGIPLADIAAFTIINTGTACSTPPPSTYYEVQMCTGGTPTGSTYVINATDITPTIGSFYKIYAPSVIGTMDGVNCWYVIGTNTGLDGDGTFGTVYNTCSCSGSSPSLVWQVTNADCGYGVIYDVGINGYYMNTLDGPSTFPLTSTLYGTKNSPAGINYNSSDNAITAHVTTNLPGNGNCATMYLFFNGEYGARYEQSFHGSPFVTISGVYIQTGDQVEVRVNCYQGGCP